MKATIAATIILIYTIVLFVGSLEGALLDGGFSIMTAPVTGLLIVAPAVGVYRRVNWCRIYLGIWFVFVLGIFLYLPLRGEFHFSLIYLAILFGGELPYIPPIFLPAPEGLYTEWTATRDEGIIGTLKLVES